MDLFFRCTSLTSVTIPNSVNYIKANSFQGCKALTTISIPNSVIKFGEDAFSDCEELKDVYCYAEKLPYIRYYWSDSPCTNLFVNSYIEYATLHVPETSINLYQTTEPWSVFGTIKTLKGDTPEVPKCATPTITVENGKLKFNCETEGVKFFSKITVADGKEYESSEISLTTTYKVDVYATKDGYENSETVTKDIKLSVGTQGDVNGDGIVNVADHVKLSEIIMEQQLF